MPPRRLVNRSQPIGIPFVFSARRGKEQPLQLGRCLPNLSRSHRSAIHLKDGTDLSASAAQEELITDVKLASIDLSLLHAKAECFVDQLHDHTPGNAFEDVATDRWSDERVAPSHEQVLARPFGDMTANIHEDRLIEPCALSLTLRKVRVNVCSGHLCADRNCCIGDAPP